TIDVPLPAFRQSDGRSYRIASGHDLGSGMVADGFVDGQLVDAGYFDNQGVDAAAAFLMHDDVLKWIGKRSARLFVIEIRAQSGLTENDDYTSPLPLVGHPVSAFLSAAAKA